MIHGGEVQELESRTTGFGAAERDQAAQRNEACYADKSEFDVSIFRTPELNLTNRQRDAFLQVNAIEHRECRADWQAGFSFS
jgi:hypothetical protein